MPTATARRTVPPRLKNRSTNRISSGTTATMNAGSSAA